MKGRLLLLAFLILPFFISAQSKFIFTGTNSTYWFDSNNWLNGNAPPISGSNSTVPSTDTVLLTGQVLINPNHRITNEGYIYIENTNDFGFLSSDEVGFFVNNGYVYISPDSRFDTGDGGRITLNSGSTIDVAGILVKEQFGSLIINGGSALNITGAGQLIIN